MADPSSYTTAPIRLRLFAALREQAGWSERDWPIRDHAIQPNHPPTEPLTPRQIWMTLQLEGSLDTVRVAINQQFAAADMPLQPGDELAFLPPISGG